MWSMLTEPTTTTVGAWSGLGVARDGARDEPDEFVAAGRRHLTVRRGTPTAQHPCAVGHPHYLIHVMADEQHGDAAGAQPPYERLHRGRLADAERRGRLVHD